MISMGKSKEALLQENLSLQGEEIEILRSMYDTDFQIEDETPTFSVTVNIAKNDKNAGEPLSFAELEKWEATLVVSYHLDYPSTSPPIYHLSVPWLFGIGNNKVDTIYKELNQIATLHKGELIVYFWIEKLREMLTDLKPQFLSEWPEPQTYRSKLIDVTEPPTTDQAKKDTQQVPQIQIFTGETLTDRKSTFQAHVATVNSVEDVKTVLRQLYQNKKILSATHNMYAYRIDKDSVPGQSSVILQDCEDDGETHAGGRLLHLLQILDCRNVVVIVSRWYGGIHLHGDRFKHINNVARVLLEKHGFIRKGSGSGAGAGGDGKNSKNKTK